MMMVAPLVFAFVAGADAPADFLPCEAGLLVRYRWFDTAGAPTDHTMQDEVLGLRGRLCTIRRTTRRADGKPTAQDYVRELLPDRVLDAGWADLLTAFRAPLLRSPLQNGQHWSFNRMEYRLERLDAVTVPAGRFAAVVRVHATGVPEGSFHAVRTYARGVGLIEDRRPNGAWRATEVTRPSSGGRRR